MSQKYTKIGFQNTDGKITALELCSDSGELSTTGKVLNNLYNSTILAKQLIKEGTNSNALSQEAERIDVSNIVGIDSYTWGVNGTNLGVGYRIFNSSSKFLELFSTDRKSWYQYLYMFSEVDSEWQVASKDNRIFRSLANEL